MNHTTHVPGSPVQPGERVTIVTTIDADVADLSHHIGRSGVVVHLNYDCGCSQQYPGDPMIGVRLDLDAARTPGEVEEFWAEELGRKAGEGGKKRETAGEIDGGGGERER